MRFRISLFLALGVCGGSALHAVPALAQETRLVSPLQLPRPGYEPRAVKLGPVRIEPDLSVTESYDSNIFATARDVEDDFVTSVSPTIGFSAARGKLDLSGDLSATVTEYARNKDEGTATFGGSVRAGYAIDRANRLTAAVRHARLSESRTDPEATRDRGESPAEYDATDAALGYSYRRNRLGVAVTTTARRVAYVSDDERDRNRFSYRGAVRGTYAVTPRFDAFLEAFAERRDFDDSVDRNGLNRDSLTTGFFLGTAVEIADKWSGEIGVGLFRADNDDPALSDFTGIGVRGAITWSVTPRTAVTAALRREDMPTITRGASGRIETRISLMLEQEVRHNFIASAEIGFQQDDYQERNRQLTSVSGQVLAEYLVNRHVSAVLAVGYTSRTANTADDEYDRFIASLGLRLRL